MGLIGTNADGITLLSQQAHKRSMEKLHKKVLFLGGESFLRVKKVGEGIKTEDICPATSSHKIKRCRKHGSSSTEANNISTRQKRSLGGSKKRLTRPKKQ